MVLLCGAFVTSASSLALLLSLWGTVLGTGVALWFRAAPKKPTLSSSTPSIAAASGTKGGEGGDPDIWRDFPVGGNDGGGSSGGGRGPRFWEPCFSEGGDEGDGSSGDGEGGKPNYWKAFLFGVGGRGGRRRRLLLPRRDMCLAGVLLIRVVPLALDISAQYWLLLLAIRWGASVLMEVLVVVLALWKPRGGKGGGGGG